MSGGGGSTLGRTVASGAVWQVLAMAVPLAVNLPLTPHVYAAMGGEAFGIFVWVNGITLFMAAFDGGIGRSAQRYFTVFAGRGDAASMTRLLCSLATIVVSVMGVVFAGLYWLCPLIAQFFHVPAPLLSDTIFLLRTCVVLVGFALLRNLFAALLYAHHRFRVTSTTLMVSYIFYTLGILWSVTTASPLVGIALSLVAQQAVATVSIVPQALRYLRRDAIGWVSRSELAEFVRYAAKAQVSGLVQITSLQSDLQIMQRMVPGSSAWFGAPANFANQLRMLPMNVMNPMNTALGRRVGADGVAGAQGTYLTLQRTWVRVLTVMVAAGASATFFGVSVWLPIPGNLHGWVAALLAVANLVGLLPLVMVNYVTQAGRPEADMWLGIGAVSLRLVLVFAVIGVWGGVGVATAAIMSQVIAVVCSRALAARWMPEVRLRAPWRDVPWLAGIVAAGVSWACTRGVFELVTMGVVPRGALGLVACGVGALPAVVLYVLLVWGPRRTFGVLAQRLRRPTQVAAPGVTEQADAEASNSIPGDLAESPSHESPPAGGVRQDGDGRGPAGSRQRPHLPSQQHEQRR